MECGQQLSEQRMQAGRVTCGRSKCVKLYVACSLEAYSEIESIPSRYYAELQYHGTPNV